MPHGRRNGKGSSLFRMRVASAAGSTGQVAPDSCDPGAEIAALAIHSKALGAPCCPWFDHLLLGVGIVIAVLLAGSGGIGQAAPIPVLEFKRDPDGVTFTMSPGIMKITVCYEDVIRVMYTPNRVLPPGQDFVVTNRTWPRTGFKVTDTQNRVRISTRKLRVEVDKTTGALTFLDAKGQVILREPPGGGKKMVPVVVNGEASFQPEQAFLSPADEFIFGLGQYQEGIWNWRGMPQQLRQVNTQIAVPVVLSSHGYGLFWNNASLTEFNPVDTEVPLTNKVGTFTSTEAGEYVFFVKDGDRRNLIGIQVDGRTLVAITNMWVPYTIAGKKSLPANYTCSVAILGGGSRARLYARPLGETTTFRSEVGDAIDYFFFYGPSPDEIIAGYRRVSGAVPLFPKAAYGFWQCRERYSSQEQILAAAREFRARKIPVDFIIQDWQYWGPHGWGAYQWDLRHYPDPTNMIAELHANNFKFMISVWSNPEGIVGRALASMSNGLIPGSKWMDVFNPAVRRLRWEYMNAAFFSIGTDGWWQDATEPGDDGDAVSNVQCYLGSANRVRNSYPLFANMATYEGQRNTTSSKRVVILSRSAYAGQQRYAAAVWSGDVNGDWVTFARQIPAGLNFSLTGMPYWTTDTGGFFRPRGQYNSPEYNELLVRWFQWSTFCPIMRIHGYQSATEVWRWLPETQTNMIKYLHLRYRLLPYIYSVAWKTTSEHYTPMRALVMDFAHDPRALGISDQHMFGPAFLVCPVTTPNATNRQVYLPADTAWVDFWTGETHTGGKTITANAPLSVMPLYVRAGSIVPLGPPVQYATEKAADPIELRVYAGADGKFVLYEDEGDNYDYERGVYSTIPFEWNEAQQLLTIGRRMGSFPGMLRERTFHIVWVSKEHGTGLDSCSFPDVVIRYEGNPVKVTAKP